MCKIMLVGPPGGGKGSQAQRIAPALGIPHISTGDLLREAMRVGTELGQKAKALVEAGDLVPDDLMIELVKERLAQDDAMDGYLLDGFPRTLAQAQAFDQTEKLSYVFNIDVPHETIIKRLTGRRVCANGHTTHLNQLTGEMCPYCGAQVAQRKDDAPETVTNRLNTYETLTKPLVDHYRAQGILHDIDGTGSIEEGQGRIMKVLG